MCTSPTILKKKDRLGNYKVYRCRCGKCPSCLRDDRRAWAFRMQCEFEVTHKGLFLTLTYSNEYLVYSDSGYPTLYYPDIQKFLKRLRAAYAKKVPQSEQCPLTYWCCGEYGKTTGRPHYHLILFGLDKKYKSLVDDAWTFGYKYFGYQMSSKCINYVAKYVDKQGTIKQLSEVIGSDVWCDDRDVVRPMRHMSLGLGVSYLTKDKVLFHLGISSEPVDELSVPIFIHGELKYSTPVLDIVAFKNENGDIIKYPLPRYYRRKIFRDNLYNIYDYGISQSFKFDSYFYDYSTKCIRECLPLSYANCSIRDCFEAYTTLNQELDEIKDHKLYVELQRSHLDKTDYCDLSQDELYSIDLDECIKNRSVPVIF